MQGKCPGPSLLSFRSLLKYLSPLPENILRLPLPAGPIASFLSAHMSFSTEKMEISLHWPPVILSREWEPYRSMGRSDGPCV